MTTLEDRMEQARLRVRLDNAMLKNGEVDATTGAPFRVRMLMSTQPDRKDRLATLKTYAKDARPMPEDEDNYLFTHPKTGRPTVFDPEGFEAADVADFATMAAETVGGALGAGAGAPLGPGGSAVGAGLGVAAGREVARLAGMAFGAQESANPLEATAEAAAAAALGAAGQRGGEVAGNLLAQGTRALIRGPGKAAFEKTSAALQDFIDIGAKPSVGTVTQRRWADSIESLLSRAPGGAGQIAKVAQETLDKVSGFVNRRMARLTGRADVDPEIVGRAVRQGIEDFAGRFKQRGWTLFNALDKHIPGDAPAKMTNTLSTLDVLANPVPEAAQTSRALGLAKFADLKQAVLDDISHAIQARGFPPGALPFSALKRIRSTIGNRLATPSLVDDIPRADLKRLYAAISEDMRVAAVEAGPGAVKAFGKADRFYRAGIKRVEDVLDPLVKKDAPEKIFRALELSGKEGATTIRAVTRSLTNEQKRLLAGGTAVRLGRATAGQQDDLGGAFSLQTFLTNWNRISDKAKAALFEGPGMQSVRRDLDKIARVAFRQRESGRAFTNPPNTAGAMVGQSLMFVGGGGTALGLATGNTSLLTLSAMLGTGMLGANGAARLMTSPRFVRWLARGAKVKPNGIGAHLGRLGGIAALEDHDTRAAIQQYLGAFTTTMSSPNVGVSLEPRG